MRLGSNGVKIFKDAELSPETHPSPAFCDISSYQPARVVSRNRSARLSQQHPQRIPASTRTLRNSTCSLAPDSSPAARPQASNSLPARAQQSSSKHVLTRRPTATLSKAITPAKTLALLASEPRGTIPDSRGYRNELKTGQRRQI